MRIRDRIRMKTVGTGAMVAIAMTIGLAFAAVSFGSSQAFAHTQNYYIGYNDGRSAAYRAYYFNISCPTDQPHTPNYCAGYADGFSAAWYAIHYYHPYHPHPYYGYRGYQPACRVFCSVIHVG